MKSLVERVRTIFANSSFRNRNIDECSQLSPEHYLLLDYIVEKIDNSYVTKQLKRGRGVRDIILEDFYRIQRPRDNPRKFVGLRRLKDRIKYYCNKLNDRTPLNLRTKKLKPVFDNNPELDILAQTYYGFISSRARPLLVSATSISELKAVLFVSEVIKLYSTKELLVSCREKKPINYVVKQAAKIYARKLYFNGKIVNLNEQVREAERWKTKLEQYKQQVARTGVLDSQKREDIARARRLIIRRRSDYTRLGKYVELKRYVHRNSRLYNGVERELNSLVNSGVGVINSRLQSVISRISSIKRGVNIFSATSSRDQLSLLQQEVQEYRLTYSCLVGA